MKIIFGLHGAISEPKWGDKLVHRNLLMIDSLLKFLSKIASIGSIIDVEDFSKENTSHSFIFIIDDALKSSLPIIEWFIEHNFPVSLAVNNTSLKREPHWWARLDCYLDTLESINYSEKLKIRKDFKNDILKQGLSIDCIEKKLNLLCDSYKINKKLCSVPDELLPLTLDELIPLMNRGVTMLPHGCNHIRVTRTAQVKYENDPSYKFIYELTGKNPSFWVEPFGFQPNKNIIKTHNNSIIILGSDLKFNLKNNCLKDRIMIGRRSKWLYDPVNTFKKMI